MYPCTMLKAFLKRCPSCVLQYIQSQWCRILWRRSMMRSLSSTMAATYSLDDLEEAELINDETSRTGELGTC